MKGLGLGLWDGVTGVVTAPYKGAKKDGAKGFGKGFGKGLLGLITKPASGVVGLVGHTVQGAANTPGTIKRMQADQAEKKEIEEEEKQSNMVRDYEQEEFKTKYVGNDTLKFGSVTQITKTFGDDENILYIGEVMKQNRFYIWQKRNLMLTTQHLCNLEGQNFKRSIYLSKLKAITKSKQ